MNKKLFVGNLSYTATEDSLKSKFEEVGAVVSVVIIKDKMTGRSKGFAFVEMETEELAKLCMEKLDGVEVDGRPIVVKEANPEKPRNN